MKFSSSPGLAGLVALTLAGCDGDFEPEQPPRTVRLTAGPAVKVGRALTSCSHGPATASRRFCAFARPLDQGGAELWVVDVQRALAGEAPCDGSSPHCLRLTSELWTGQPLFSPAHPDIHAFHGDTLVFYARSTTGNGDQAYQGPVHAWRPDAGPARAITGDRGRVCVGHDRSAGAICIDGERMAGAAVEFDLLAGTVGPGLDGPLPRIEAIRPLDEDGDLLWQVAFSPSGSHLAFSDQVPEGLKQERLRVLPVGDLGRTQASELLRDAAAWQFSPDGRRIYFLRGFNYGADETLTGILAVADFPSGANPRELQPRVGRYQVLGEPGGPTRALGLFQDMGQFSGRFSLLRDPANPGALTLIGTDVEDALVSPDLRHSLLYGEDREGNRASFIARNDGSGQCQVAAHPGRDVYATTFLSGPPLLLWAEDDPHDPTLIQGWLGDLDTCEARQQFSSALALYEPTRAGVVWADLEDGARALTLRYAPLAGGALDLGQARELHRTIDTQVTVIDGRYLLYSVSQGSPENTGLFLHGPL